MHHHSSRTNKTNNIVLIGPMGTGKSTIGKKLARLLNKRFIDTDHEIEQQTGVDIATIFEYEGEQGFRQRERAFIQEICKQNNIVIATGGGAILQQENRQSLKESGIVIYLHASLKSLLARTEHDKKRPLLQTDNPELTLKTLIKEREILYKSIADIEIDTSKTGIRAVSNRIVKLLQNRSPQNNNT